MSELNQLSVIIPVGPGDLPRPDLLEALAALPAGAEILFSGPEAPAVTPLAARGARWVTGPRGRARQQNQAAREAKRKFLWFLHADSRVTAEAFGALDRALRAAPGALHYFDLRFERDGPALTALNNRGVWIRSHLMGMPFGDQGLCLARDTFARLGEFSERAAFGEDHLLVWAAHKAGVKLRCTGAVIHTSARKYREQGWARTTCRHMTGTALQAWPHWLEILKRRAR